MNNEVKVTVSSCYDQRVWDRQVLSLQGSFFHCHASGIYNSRIISGKPLFIEGRDNSNNCVCAVLGVLLTPKFWPFSRYSRTATFAATPIANNNQDLEKLFLEKVEHELKGMGVFKLLFESYDSKNSNNLLRALDYSVSIRNEYEFDLSVDIENLFSAFSATKRKNYRYAEKHGVVTRVVAGSDALEIVERFRNVSMDRRSLAHAKKDELISAARRVLYDSGLTRVLVSYIDEEPVGACVFAVFNNRVYGLRGGSTDLGYKKFSMLHLYWTAIKLFQSEGYESLSLGGAKHSEHGLRKFKQMLGAIETPQPTGSKVISPLGAMLDGLRKKLKP